MSIKTPAIGGLRASPVRARGYNISREERHGDIGLETENRPSEIRQDRRACLLPIVRQKRGRNGAKTIALSTTSRCPETATW